MTTSLDLNLLPLARFAGQDLADLPGLHVAVPPRRPARGRANDRLILYFALTGNAALSSGKQEQLLTSLAKMYYETAGSVTAALRAVTESLNHFLLDRNVKNASTGRQAIGLLSLVAARDDQFYLSQSGPVHAFIITAADTEYLYDPQMAGRGLGLSRTTPIRYFQSNLQPGDTLLLATQPSPTWTKAALAGAHGQGPETLRRRLFDRAALDLNAVLIQARPGKGKTFVVAPRTAAAAMAVEGASQEIVAPGQSTQSPAPRPAPETAPPELHAAPLVAASAFEVAEAHTEILPVSTPEAHEESHLKTPQEESIPGQLTAEAQPDLEPDDSVAADDEEDFAGPVITFSLADDNEPAPATTKVEIEDGPVSQASTGLPKAALAAGAAALGETGQEPGLAPQAPANQTANDSQATASSNRRRERQAVDMAPVAGALGAIAAPLGNAARRAGQAGRTLFQRMLPIDALAAIPSSAMAFIAIAVPLVIVAIASVVYLERGRAAEYQILVDQLTQQVQIAQAQPDLLMQRAAWNAAGDTLKQAEAFGVTPETQALRSQIQNGLDGMDLVKRANYQPAIIGGLPDATQITRLVISDGDLYLLDSSTGKVLRALVTGRGYEIDRSFQCGPGIVDAELNGPVIDIAPWPSGNKPEAAVLAMDASGNVLFCNQGEPPSIQKLAAPPSMTLDNLKGYTVDVTDLYALDPAQNAVWVYWNGKFKEAPQFFFGDNVPPLADVVNMAADNNELYLLHKDGHLTLCYFGGLVGVTPTRCTDPVPYIDMRPGHENTPLSPTYPFSQILFNPPPDPSLYFLEPQSQAIYHFSLRNLAFQRQFLPQEELPGGPATAFATDQVNRTLYLAVGNDVYYANIP